MGRSACNLEKSDEWCGSSSGSYWGGAAAIGAGAGAVITGILRGGLGAAMGAQIGTAIGGGIGALAIFNNYEDKVVITLEAPVSSWRQTMICDVILSKINNKYVARAKDWPEVMVEGKSRDEAIQQLKTRLIDYLTYQIEIIQIEIPLPPKTGNPWLDKFGWFKDDPTFDDLEAEIAAYRQEIDQALE